MKSIGESTLWVERYRPQCADDYIATAETKKVLSEIIKTNDIPNLLLYSRCPGTGKTSFAGVVAKELGCDLMYINASLERSIDTIRYKVTQFSMTSSLMGGKKLVVLDEAEKLTNDAQDALKVLVEQVEANARFIFCTNNMQKIIPPLISRCQVVSFEHSDKDMQQLMLQYFKRMQFVLDNEKVEYDKAVLAEIVKKLYPDLRKMLGEMQKFSKMHGKIDAGIFGSMDDTQTVNLINEMKSKKFNSVRTICSAIDPAQFYVEFYKQLNEYLKPTCIPDIILIIGRYAFQHSSTIDPEINLVACVVEIMQTAEWK